jgi:hypothetical protein
MGKIWLIISLAFILTQTMTLYGFLSNLIGKKGDSLRAIILGIGASFGLMNVYKWCCDAQKVEERVSIICVVYSCTACSEGI